MGAAGERGKGALALAFTTINKREGNARGRGTSFLHPSPRLFAGSYLSPALCVFFVAPSRFLF